jgi:hypothetical protein
MSCGKRGCRCGRGFDCGCRRRRECSREFRRILAELRGSGFNVSILTRGAHFAHQKVVSFEDNVIFTVNPEGCVRATCIDRIDSVDF